MYRCRGTAIILMDSQYEFYCSTDMEVAKAQEVEQVIY